MEEGKAVPFVSINEHIQNGKANYQFKLQPEVFQIFRSKKILDKKLAIVTVAGPQRTGKSFLSNRLLKRMKGFAVGPTTMPCTKGLWIWGQPVKINEDTVMLLVDTEGLNSVQRDINVDLKIFSLSILLSSVFIYNSIGHIDEKALQNMSYVLKVTENLRLSCDKSDQNQIAKYFPYFYWVLRDFSLDLKGQTQNEYLQSSLKAVNNDEKDPKNQIRKKIRKLFSQRRCQCFPRPLNQQDKLAHIEDQNYEQLRPVFRQKMTAFQNTFYSNLPVKLINGKPLTGQIFLNLMEEYIQALNVGKVPEILTSLQRVVSAQARKVKQSMEEGYKKAMNSLCKDENLPMDQIQIHNNHHKFIGEIKVHIDRKLKNWSDLGKIQQLKKQLFNNLQNQYKSLVSHNDKVSKTRCTEYMNKILEIPQPNLTNAESVSAYLITEKSKEFQSKIKDYFEKNKAPRKYIFFSEKFPSEIFRYFDLMVTKIRKVYEDQLTLMRKQVNQARAQTDSIKRSMKQQQNTVLSLEKQSKAVGLERDRYRRQIQTTMQMKRHIEQIEQMNTNQAKKQLTKLKQQFLQVQNENERLTGVIDILKQEIHQKKIQISNLHKRRPNDHEASTNHSEGPSNADLPNELVTNLTNLKEKLSIINQFYSKKIADQNMDDVILNEIEKIRRDKHTTIERMKQEMRNKKQEARSQIQKIQDRYEKNIDLMNKHIDMIKQENMELQKKLNSMPGNQKRINNLINEKRRFEESIKIKQSNLMLMGILNMQKDKDLEAAKNTINQVYDRLAILNAEKANFESFKETFTFILRETINKVRNNKGNKLKHSLKTLSEQDRGIILQVLEQQKVDY